VLNIKNYTSLREKYFYVIVFVIIFNTVVNGSFRFYTEEYIYVLYNVFILVTTLLFVYLHERNPDLRRAVLRIFWFASFATFSFIIYKHYDLHILLLILFPLIASVLLDVKHFLFHGKIFLSIFILMMIYGFMNIGDYPYLKNKDFLITSINLFLFVLIHSTVYNTTMQHTFRELERANLQKEVLLKEIHHRVKNNLNIIASILGLEKFESTSDEVHKLISQNKLRIESIAMVHDILYQSTEFENISFKSYLSKLSNHILYTESNEGDIALKLDIVPLHLGIESMMQFGIIINELMTNSIKYAFPTKKGEISITLQKHEHHYKLIYQDNGIGLQSNQTGFGQNLINISVQQLEGTLEMTNKNGLKYEILFQKDPS
jgi:two-component sensor histidine kinase